MGMKRGRTQNEKRKNDKSDREERTTQAKRKRRDGGEGREGEEKSMSDHDSAGKRKTRTKRGKSEDE